LYFERVKELRISLSVPRYPVTFPEGEARVTFFDLSAWQVSLLEQSNLEETEAEVELSGIQKLEDRVLRMTLNSFLWDPSRMGILYWPWKLLMEAGDRNARKLIGFRRELVVVLGLKGILIRSQKVSVKIKEKMTKERTVIFKFCWMEVDFLIFLNGKLFEFAHSFHNYFFR